MVLGLRATSKVLIVLYRWFCFLSFDLLTMEKNTEFVNHILWETNVMSVFHSVLSFNFLFSFHQTQHITHSFASAEMPSYAVAAQ